jgi:hypothetical protein
MNEQEQWECGNRIIDLPLDFSGGFFDLAKKDPTT